MISTRYLQLIAILMTILATISIASADEVIFSNSPTPIVIWHGMGDCCCYPWSMGRIVSLLQNVLPGVYVKSLMVGSNIEEDIVNGFFMDINKQIDFVAQELQKDPKLAHGFHAIGFSQGSQFFRGYIQRYNSPPVLTYVSIGGQHQGVYGLPNCPGSNYTLCDWVRRLINYGAYIPEIQNHVVQAQYWHDPLDEETYLQRSAFLADINNARSVKNAKYKENILKLKNFVMIKFEDDQVVQPRESQWFGFYAPGQADIVLPLEQTPLYTEDWLGLKQLNDSGRLHFISTPGEHLRFTDEWFVTNIVKPFLNTTIGVKQL